MNEDWSLNMKFIATKYQLIVSSFLSSFYRCQMHVFHVPDTCCSFWTIYCDSWVDGTARTAWIGRSRTFSAWSTVVWDSSEGEIRVEFAILKEINEVLAAVGFRSYCMVLVSSKYQGYQDYQDKGMPRFFENQLTSAVKLTLTKSLFKW